MERIIIDDLEEYKDNLCAILKFLLDFGKGQKKSVTIPKNLQMGLTMETVQHWEQALLSAVSTNDEELDQETAGAWRVLTKNGLEFLLSKNKLKKIPCSIEWQLLVTIHKVLLK